MRRLHLQLQRIGPHFRTVLIRGEAGTGKKLVARTLHRLSQGACDPFVTCHAGTLEEALAVCSGRGTLFLDTINEMPVKAQARLLEALDEHEVQQNRPGLRMIASTTEDLRILASTGRLRLELYERLATVEIILPPLRERIEDLAALARYFLERFASLHGKEPREIADGAMEQMLQYLWPGNVQELEDVLGDCVLQAETGLLEAHHLPAFFGHRLMEQSATQVEESLLLQDVVEQHVLRVLKSCSGNKLRAANMLGISRSTLYRMLEATASGDNSQQARESIPQKRA